MAITIKDLAQSTQYALLKDKTGRIERITDYINSVDTKWPAKLLIRNRKEQFWKDNKDEYNKLKTNADDDEAFTQFFNKFNGEQDLIDQIKPLHIKQIDELLKEQATDDELIKELKATARAKAGEISDYYDNADGGITWGDFLIDLIRDYYLKDAPAYINEKLTENGILLSELDKKKWDQAKSNLFSNCYSIFTDDKKESDLDGLIKAINEQTEDIKDLIIEARQKKESDKDKVIKALNEQITTLTANQEKHKPSDLKPEDLPADWEQQLRDKATLEADKTKWKEEKKELVKLGGEQATKITALEQQITDLKKEVAAKPTPAPSPTPTTGGGTTPSPQPIAGTEEWVATAKFLTEPDFGKAMQYFKELFNKEWTATQRHTIFHILKANEDNWNWAEGKWGRRFDI